VGGGGLGCFDDIVRVLAFFFEAVVSCFIFSCSFIYHIMWLFINFSFLAELRLSTDVSYGSQLYRKRLNYFLAVLWRFASSFSKYIIIIIIIIIELTYKNEIG
jgi:hypothetical protein